MRIYSYDKDKQSTPQYYSSSIRLNYTQGKTFIICLHLIEVP